LVEKLHHDATERRIKHKNSVLLKEQLEDRENLKLTTNSTNLLILDKFVKDFEICLSNLFDQNRNYYINFDEFSKIFYELGFVRLPYDPTFNDEGKKEIDLTEPEHSEIRIQIFRRKNETNFLKDAWKILTGGNSALERVEANQLIVFCAAILGIYHGDDPDEEKLEEMKPLNLNTDMNKPTISVAKDKYLSPKENFLETPKTTLLTGSPGKILLKRNSTDKSELRRKEKILLKIVIPDLNMLKFSYHPKTVKQIHSIFHQLYRNRVEFLLERKKKEEIQRKIVYSENSISLTEPFNSKQNLDDKTNESAAHYRHQLYHVLLYTKLN